MERKHRFHPKEVMPEVPDNAEIAKFYGKPVLVPKRQPGEKVDKAGFTEDQRTILKFYDHQRRVEERKYPEEIEIFSAYGLND